MTTTPATLNATAAAARAALLRRDEAALRQVMDAYRSVYEAIKAQVATLAAQVAAARAAGQTVRPKWLREQNRLDRLTEAVTAAWRGFALTTAAIITEVQRESLAAAQADAVALIAAAVDEDEPPPITPLPFLLAVPGELRDGTPLAQHLDVMGLDAATAVAVAVLRGVGRERTPSQLAGDVRTTLGGSLTAALTLTRTEHLRTYRDTVLAVFRGSPAVTGWRWRANPGPRTCAVCLAMDGREFPTERPFPQHPNCRCTIEPITRGNPDPERTLGKDWFAQQDEATQRRVLGPTLLSLYQQGAITLDDLVAQRVDPRWGPVLRRRTVAEVEAIAVGRA